MAARAARSIRHRFDARTNAVHVLRRYRDLIGPADDRHHTSEGSRTSASPDVWDRRAARTGLHAVLTDRWSLKQCAEVDRLQREALWAALPSIRGSNVLDLGCGIGRITRWLAHRARRQAVDGAPTGEAVSPPHVIGVDHSGHMIRRAATEIRLPNVGFVQARSERLPFPDSSFDTVVTSSVLQHVIATEDFEATCAGLARVLRPGGALVCLEGVRDGGQPPGVVVGTATATFPRSLDQLAVALAPSLYRDYARPLRCVDDVYMVTRWIRDAEVTR